MFVICKITVGIDWEWSRTIWSIPHGVINGFIPKNVFIANNFFKWQPIAKQTVGACGPHLGLSNGIWSA